jgi:hypothetical protein
MRGLRWVVLGAALLLGCGQVNAVSNEISSGASRGDAGTGADPKPSPAATLTLATTGPGNVSSTPSAIDCGPNCSASLPVGTAVTLTATASAGARFVGWAGACSGAQVCTLTLSSDAEVAARFEAEKLTLVASVNRTALAINSGDLFYSAYEVGPGDQGREVIRAIPKSGGASRVVAVSPAAVAAIRASDGWVYWTTDANPGSAVYRAPTPGGTAQAVFQGHALTDLALDERNVYFADLPGTGAGSGAVFSVAITGGEPVLLASGVTPWGGLTVDASDVWFVDEAVDAAFIKRVPKSGGATTTLVSCTGSPYCSFPVVRADAQNIYYRDRGGSVHARSKNGNVAVTIATASSGTDLDVHGGVLFWDNDWWNPRWNPNPSPVPGVMKANTDGTEARSIDSEVLGGWHSPRADDRAVFYIRNGAIVRRLR